MTFVRKARIKIEINPYCEDVEVNIVFALTISKIGPRKKLVSCALEGNPGSKVKRAITIKIRPNNKIKRCLSR